MFSLVWDFSNLFRQYLCIIGFIEHKSGSRLLHSTSFSEMTFLSLFICLVTLFTLEDYYDS